MFIAYRPFDPGPLSNMDRLCRLWLLTWSSLGHVERWMTSRLRMTLRALCFSLSSSELLRGSIEDLTGWSEPASLRARQREKMPVARIGLRVLEALQSAFAWMFHPHHLLHKSVERRLELRSRDYRGPLLLWLLLLLRFLRLLLLLALPLRMHCSGRGPRGFVPVWESCKKDLILSGEGPRGLEV